MSLFDSGIRPLVDAYLKEQAEAVRDYGEYWSASSAGYCMRLNIMRRLGVPRVPEIQEGWERTTRVFESGHIFHEWIQRITIKAGLSVASEVELQDEDLMIRGHFDDLVLVPTRVDGLNEVNGQSSPDPSQHLILYDYKTAHSKSFEYAKSRPMSHYHKMQLGTYMYMLRNTTAWDGKGNQTIFKGAKGLTEARILKISKDDLRMAEDQLMWSEELGTEVKAYWTTLNKYWKDKKMPPCTCLEKEGGFMGKRTKAGKVYNDFFYNDEPCSLVWYEKFKKGEL